MKDSIGLAQLSKSACTRRNVEIREVKKGKGPMYEASEIVVIGAAHQLILGAKPELLHLDAEGSAGYDERLMDIDETDV